MTVSTELGLPVVELQPFLQDPNSKQSQQECELMAKALFDYGAFVIRDPRVTEQHNQEFLDLLEDYFSQPETEVRKDARPQYAYQVGVTPELIETPRCTFDPACKDFIDSQLSADNKPHMPQGPDPKWRYFWRIGERPPKTAFPGQNAEEVVPELFADRWPATMNKWGQLLHAAVSTCAEMAAVGFHMPADTFTHLTKYGSHLLAPTASNLAKYNSLDTIFAGFHYDLNFLTIHGKSRYPGLYIWKRTGEKVAVKVPDGCLLVQAGKQMEYLTGGHVMAGYHEVVVTDDTLRAVERAKAAGRPLWRISSTLFCHVGSDNELKPLGQFATAAGSEEVAAKYPPILAGLQVHRELESIKLAN